MHITKKITVLLLAAGLAWCLFSCNKEVADPLLDEDVEMYVPRAFTPDGDGVNDTFYVRGKNIVNYKIEIFDPTKTKVFSSSNINEGWDGRYKGQALPADNYQWIITFRTEKSDSDRTGSGYVELIR